MYEERFDLDWSTLSSDEALERMFALGVAAALGERNDDEYERIRSTAESPYDRSVLELSFTEGRRRADGNRQRFGSDHEAWATIVGEELDGVPKPGRKRGESTPMGMTRAVERAPFLDPDTDELERIRLPDVLRREKSR
ncbi:MAG: hypothetical protein ACQETI_04485 [Halobacteriota archaeon]